MIVDCHTHITCGSSDLGLAEHLEAAEPVDACLVLATPDGPADKVNGAVGDYVEKHKTKMVGFAFLDPTSEPVGVKNTRAITEKIGLAGVSLYCSRCAFHPAHSRAMQFYESAEQLGLPVFFHGGPLGPDGALEFAQPFLLDEVARTFPGLKIIVGNMGLPFFEQTLCLVDKHKNVYADLTIRPGNVWQVYNVVTAANEQGVMDKLLFGSGFPAARATECIETLLGLNRLMGGANLPSVPRSNIRAVIEQDALALLGIKK